MKPKEFDGLVRKKFDQNDFAYNPGNWDKLAEKLDGKEKKRSLIMWWWVPLAGMAASVMMAMGVTSMMHQQGTGNAPVQQSYAQAQRPAQGAPVAAISNEVNDVNNRTTHYKHIHTAPAVKDNTDEWFAIKYDNATTGDNGAGGHKNINLLAENDLVKKRKKIVPAEPMPTFKPEIVDAKPAPKLSIILSGGVNRGNQNSGYMAGVSVRRMVTNKVYVEGDVSFAASQTTQSDPYLATTTTTTTRMAVAGTAAGKHSTGKTTALVSKTPEATGESYAVKDRDISYNLYYAQVTPSIGYKLLKRMSIGLGPDFQQMLVDNRPAPSTADRGNLQSAPILDIGFIGKTEYAITKKVKAAVYYRKGVNDVISTSDRYINRDYLQFQVKCVIFNK